jgi:putative NIF3 family GTP cyclohydrolase 1 type 2
MKTAEVAASLDAYFRLDSYGPEDFAEIIDFWREAGVPFKRYVTPRFAERTNGLMLDSAPEVARVFTLVFPSEEVLTEVERRAGGEPALIFTHHPMDFETSGHGLMAIAEEWLRRLKEAGISFYSAHAPLDCHERISTSRALARAIGVPVEATFAEYMGGHAGVYGRTGPTPLADFVERVKRACGVECADLKEYGFVVERVAVCAGGAAFPSLMQEALDAGCDTYVTGDFRVRHGGPWAEEHVPEFDAFVAGVPMNLIGGSHAGTEGLVLKRDMIEWFEKIGLPAEYVPQSDLWR